MTSNNTNTNTATAAAAPAPPAAATTTTTILADLTTLVTALDDKKKAVFALGTLFKRRKNVKAGSDAEWARAMDDFATATEVLVDFAERELKPLMDRAVGAEWKAVDAAWEKAERRFAMLVGNVEVKDKEIRALLGLEDEVMEEVVEGGEGEQSEEQGGEEGDADDGDEDGDGDGDEDEEHDEDEEEESEGEEQ